MKYENLENVSVRVEISGYNRKKDCTDIRKCSFFNDKQKSQIINLVDKFLDKRAKLLKKNDGNKTKS